MVIETTQMTKQFDHREIINPQITNPNKIHIPRIKEFILSNR
jgi:hypothetical protein